MHGMSNMETQDEIALEPPQDGGSDDGDRRLGPEGIAFIIDIGLCPGSECPRSKHGCDPRCPALEAWVREVAGG